MSVPIPEYDIFLKEELDCRSACQSADNFGYLLVLIPESFFSGRFVQLVAMSVDPQLTELVG